MGLNNKVIVFGCNHQNMLGLVRSLGEKGVHPYCILLKSKEGMVFSSKYPFAKVWVESPEAGLDYIVNYFSSETVKPILLSSDDMTETLFDKNASTLREHFIVPASSEDGRLTQLMDKQNIGALAKKHGFIIPAMHVMKKGDQLPRELSFPVFTKSVKSIDGGKNEERKCNNATELEKALKESRSGELLVQQFIDKKDEIDLIGFVANGEVFMPYIQHQMRFSDHAYGGYHRFDKVVVDSPLYRQVLALLKEIDFQGLFSVEFLVDKSGSWFFTEVNFRHDGHTYLLTPGGVNIPWLYCEAVTTGAFHCDLSRAKDPIIGMNEYVDISQFVKTGKISILKWLRQFATADSHTLWNWRDPAPAFHYIKNLLFKR